MKSQNGWRQRGGRIPSPIPSSDGPDLCDAPTTRRAMALSLNVLADITRVKPYDGRTLVLDENAAQQYHRPPSTALHLSRRVIL